MLAYKFKSFSVNSINFFNYSDSKNDICILSLAVGAIVLLVILIILKVVFDPQKTALKDT